MSIQEFDPLQMLKSDIKNKSPRNLYIFFGEETFLLHYYLDQLKKILIDPVTESFNYHRITPETYQLRYFAESVENMPMMAERTLVRMDDVDLFRLNESEREKMIEIISDIPGYTTVILSYETVSWKPDKRQKKLWDALQKHGLTVEFAKQSERDLIAWIGRHFAANGKKITSGLCSYLIGITDGTMTSLAGEISKISAYSDGEEITKQDIDTVVEPVIDAVVFQMTDMISVGDYGGALRKLQDLLRMQQEPIVIMGAISNHLRRIGIARILFDNGRPASELMRICAMSDYPARKLMSSAGKFSVNFCRKASELAVETDYAMKMSMDDPQRLLELLILRLAEEAQHD